MGQHLPLELIALIAEYRRDDSKRFLTQYALVGRTWQAAFEPFIYDRVWIHSEPFTTGKRATSIEALSLNTPHVVARRKMIREIFYCIILPLDLPDYERIIVKTSEQTYTPHSFIRRANNQAFTGAILSLFRFLASVDAEQRVTIRFETLGRDKGYDPGTVPWDRPGAARGKWAVRPYRAESSNHNGPLPRAPCVDRIIADDQWLYRGNSKRIRLEAACWIAQACPALSQFEWEADDTALPEHVDYAQHRRQAVAEALLHLPTTLQIFNLRSLTIDPLHESLPAPVLCSKEHDLLSTNLRHMSVQLREIDLYEVPLANDFLCPLNDHGKPRGQPIEWPLLEQVFISRPDFLPSGEWLKDPGPITQEFEIGDIEDPGFDYAEFIERLGRRDPRTGTHIWWDRAVINRELYLLNCISTGYAARGMPRLQLMDIGFTSAMEVSTYMQFVREQAAGEATLTWNGDGYNNHKPDERVAHAWGFALSRMAKNQESWGNDLIGDYIRYSAAVSWENPVDSVMR
ncbi:uncharacterized protein DSM5745_01773 [Aspergillus mulundensis]|uniref:F-box domain-containing protein n=1 Tax=Aspergillus mulundensis TaxID=1810919 RepID=A0A3D8SW20_9EURO|nr:Uncharacterized protein DSM5745_01773 [Aspergillus mulundensis]RDW89998.1 Uncharacterized protein DSM5745_01773 [Aspergillus mulundensis]